MFKKPKVVVALGGNAIQKNNEATAEEQQKAVAQTAEQLANIIKIGYVLAITHGNGPQVGNIMLQQEAGNSFKTPAMPIDTCDAMSQGMIGYWMANALDNAFERKAMGKRAVSLITRSLVSVHDRGFIRPEKPVGPFYQKAEAEAMMNRDPVLFQEDSGRGYRRVVASPYPNEILEYQAISDLMDRGYAVIAVGGGGIPVIRTEKGLKGVEAVIDKDYGALKLAEGIDADILLILTNVDHVFIHFNTPAQRPLINVSADELDQYATEGQFAPGSMLPKIRAAVSFVRSKPGRKAIITSLDHAKEALSGERIGTIICDSGSQYAPSEKNKQNTRV